MAFFSAQNAGLAFMIVAVISIIAAVLTIILNVAGVDGFTDQGLVYFVILAIGELICACLYFVYGRKVRSGEIDRKIDILANFVRIVGLTSIIGAIFGVVAGLVENMDLGTLLGGAIISIIIGLIALFMASKINDGKQTTGDKIIWIILLVLFVLGLIGAIIEIIAIITIIVGICDLIIYSFMILLLIDEEVKSEMGI